VHTVPLCFAVLHERRAALRKKGLRRGARRKEKGTRRKGKGERNKEKGARNKKKGALKDSLPFARPADCG